MKAQYQNQVSLLLESLPYALQDARFALKGGTAINLFHQKFPRLSVDIDLCYLPLEDRRTSFKNIHYLLEKMKTSLEKQLSLKVEASFPLDGKKEAKLFVSNKDALIKIEPNYTLRGCVFDPVKLPLSKEAAIEFEKDVTIQCLNLADAYGGKICAALDRQHPRDLFDVKILFEGSGITKEVKESFLFYLLSHRRPIDELLNPKFKDISETYRKEFVDMAINEVSFEELNQVKERLVKEIKASLTGDDKSFILGFAGNAPNWQIYNHPKIQNFPSIKWKMHNQGQMPEKKRELYIAKIAAALK